MTRTELENYILETYPADMDFPWVKHPNYQVFRHRDSKKWFALVMDVPKNKLGLQGEDVMNVVNFKCDPEMIGSLRMSDGYFPAYHMSKDSWITVAFDGGVEESEIKMLLDISFDLTDSHKKKKRSKENE